MIYFGIFFLSISYFSSRWLPRSWRFVSRFIGVDVWHRHGSVLICKTCRRTGLGKNGRSSWLFDRQDVLYTDLVVRSTSSFRRLRSRNKENRVEFAGKMVLDQPCISIVVTRPSLAIRRIHLQFNPEGCALFFPSSSCQPTMNISTYLRVFLSLSLFVLSVFSVWNRP